MLSIQERVSIEIQDLVNRVDAGEYGLENNFDVDAFTTDVNSFLDGVSVEEDIDADST